MADLVKVGLNYRPDGAAADSPEKRAEAGDVVDDIPAESRGWLLDQGVIEAQGLAKGGFIPPVPGGRLVRVAEAREPELVTPAPARRGKER